MNINLGPARDTLQLLSAVVGLKTFRMG